MRSLIYIFITVLFIQACQSVESNKISGIITVDRTEKVNFTDLFKDVRLIFPESDNELGFFGLTINRIETYKDKIFFLNQKSRDRNLLCFDKTGKFLFNIDRLGKGPEEYTYLGDFFIDKQQDLLILSTELDKWMFFDLNGKYLYSRKLPSTSGTVRRSSEFNDSLYVAYFDCNHCDDDYSDIIFFDKKTLQVKNMIKATNPDVAFLYPQLPVYKYKDRFFLYDAGDTIYDISTRLGEKIPLYCVDFGERQREFKRNFSEKDNNKQIAILSDAIHSKTLRIVHSFFCNDKYYAINYAETSGKAIQNNVTDFSWQTVFYDPVAEKTYNTANMDFDIFNSVTNSHIFLLGCGDDGYFYALINEPFSEDEIKEIVKSKYLSDSDKKALLKMNDMSNPIIMAFK